MTGNAWCYDCIAQQIGRWAIYLANRNFYLPTAAQTTYQARENISGGGLYFGLSWSIGLALRYLRNTILDSPQDLTNGRLPMIDVNSGEINGIYPLEQRPTFRTGSGWLYSWLVAQTTWDLLDSNNDGNDMNQHYEITLVEMYTFISTFGFSTQTPNLAQDFFGGLYRGQTNATKKAKTGEVLVYNYMFNNTSSIKRNLYVREEDGGIPDFDQLRAVLISFSMSPDLVDSGNMQELYDDALRYWFHPNSNSTWNTNRAIVSIVEQMNVNQAMSTQQVALVVPNAFSALNLVEDATGIKILDPADIITFSNTISTFVQYAQARTTFTKDLIYYYWPLPLEIKEIFKTYEKIKQKQDNKRRGEEEKTTMDLFSSVVPSSTDCPTGPVISNVAPSSGPAAGGITITITGYNFDTIQTATIGGTDCPIVLATPGQITCTLPAGVSSKNPIVLANANGVNLPDRWNFVYYRPILQSVSPSTSVLAGSSVVILGANFGPASIPISQISVTIGGNPCTSMTHQSDSQITCVIPAGSGVGNLVYVTVAGQGSDTTEVYVDYAGPFISSIAPTSGPAAGGMLTIIGSNFDTNTSNTQVFVGDTSTTILSISASRLVVGLPPLIGSGLQVEVTIDGLSSIAASTYSVNHPVIRPPITDLDTAGSYINVFGVNFGGGQFLDSINLTVGAAYPPISVLGTNDTTLYAYIPPGIGTNISVSVSVGNQMSQPVLFSYAPPSLFIYYLLEDITTKGGQEIYIIGDNFVPGEVSAGDLTYSNVTISGSLCLTNQSSWIDPQEVDCILPKGIGANNTLCIVVGSQAANECLFFDYPAPNITSFHPTKGSPNGGTVITIIGTNFVPEGINANDSNVYIGNNSCTSINWVNYTTVICEVPAGYGTNVSIIVKVGNQFSAPVFDFSYLGPIISSIVNNTLSTRGGEVTIYGDNFGNGTIAPIVHFNGSDIPTTWLNGTMIRVTIPPGTGQNKTISVTVASQTSPNVTFFSYKAPTIDSIEPRNSNTTGHVDVIIRGSNYGPGTPPPQIFFDAQEIPLKTWVDHDELIFTVPEGEGANITIQVFVDGQASNNNTQFSYNAPIIDDVQPREYPTAGGVTLSIIGINFGDGSPPPSVQFNYVDVESDRKSHMLIEITLPKGIGRAIPINVTVDKETSAQNKLFSYSRPTISSGEISTDTDGGVITIAGSSFVPEGVDAGDNSNITVDGKLCISPVWTSDTSIQCTVGAGIGKNKPVVVTVGGQASDPYNIFSYNDPTVTSVNPNHYGTQGGARITISGTNFGTGTPLPKAYLLPYQCKNTQGTATNQRAQIIPEGSGTNVGVQVTVNGTQSEVVALFNYDGTFSHFFKITTRNNCYFTNKLITFFGLQYFFNIAPHISEITPSSSGKNGKTGVKLTGTSFGGLVALAKRKVTLFLDGTPLPITTMDHETLTFTVPPSAGATTVDVYLKVDGQTSNGVSFEYTDEDSGSEDDEDEDGDDPDEPDYRPGGQGPGGAPPIPPVAIIPIIVIPILILPPLLPGDPTNSTNDQYFPEPIQQPNKPTNGGPPNIPLPFPNDTYPTHPIPSEDAKNCTITACWCDQSYFTTLLSCHCPISCGGASCVPIAPNQVPFCSSVNYNAFPRDISSDRNDLMVTPDYADQQARVVYNYFSHYIIGEPDAFKQLLCASAFLRCSDMQVFYPCRSLYQAAIDSFGDDYEQAFNASAMARYVLAQPEEECTLPGAVIPKVNSITPTHGPAAGGTRLAITGANFGTSASSRKILLGYSVCTNIIYSSASAMSCVAPAGSGYNKKLSIYVDGQVADGNFQFGYDGPVITSLSSEIPTKGGLLELRGYNFGKYLPHVTIFVDEITCNNATRYNDSYATCIVGSGIGKNHTVIIWVNGQVSLGMPINYSAPTITRIQPTYGPSAGGTSVTITGTNLVPARFNVSGSNLANMVLFGTDSCTNVAWVNDTTVTCKSPAGNGLQPLTVIVGSQNSTTNATFLYLPTVTSLNPSSGPTEGGTLVSIVGNGFGDDQSAVSVRFGNTTCTNVTILSASVITCRTSKGIGKGLAVSISVLDISSNITANFSYTGPSVSTISLAIVPPTGFTTITMKGSNFVPLDVQPLASTITVGGRTSPNITWINSTMITFVAPSGTGTQRITLTVGGQSVVVSTLVTYAAFGYIGCYFDMNTRDLPYVALPPVDRDYGNMTVQYCQQMCASAHYKYSGVQFFYQCFCGNTYGVYGNPGVPCDSPCRGASTQICGGNYANSVYLSASNKLIAGQTLLAKDSLMSTGSSGWANLLTNGSICTTSHTSNGLIWCSPANATYPIYFASMSSSGLCVYGQRTLADLGIAVWCSFGFTNTSGDYFAIINDSGILGISEGANVDNPNPPLIWSMQTFQYPDRSYTSASGPLLLGMQLRSPSYKYFLQVTETGQLCVITKSTNVQYWCSPSDDETPGIFSGRFVNSAGTLFCVYRDIGSQAVYCVTGIPAPGASIFANVWDDATFVFYAGLPNTKGNYVNTLWTSKNRTILHSLEGLAQTDIIAAPSGAQIYLTAPLNSKLQLVTHSATSTLTRCWGPTTSGPYFATLQTDQNFCEYKNTPQTKGAYIYCILTSGVLPQVPYYAKITSSTTLNIYEGIDSGANGPLVSTLTFGNC
eukprot:Phypoly_transcript_00048.p1 GENE.Phypoly_transcript_00048~~Phypoly_transcript_00048.p1  ORF type:complete len:2722 (+),score=260.03 Phypoly_transcript_00048:277-8166(+)